MSHRLLHSETVFEGKVFRVRIDQLQDPSGHEMRVDVVEHGGAVAILPLDADDQIWFVRQYRHPVQERLLELPAGTLEDGEVPQDCVIRECREEIGMSPGKIVPLGACYLAPGYSTELIEFYLARDLTHSPLSQDEDEDISVERLPVGEALDILARGEFRDAKTIAGLTLGLSHLGWLKLDLPR